jgi:hypothetical protein
MSSKPNPSLEWLHVCDHAFRDEQGKLCLIGMFDSLASLRLPGRLPVFCVAIGLTDGQGSYEVALRVEAPSGKHVDMQLPPTVLQNRKTKARAVIRLSAMPFEEFGHYVFRLVIDKQPVDHPVHVIEHMEARQSPPQDGPQFPQG